MTNEPKDRLKKKMEKKLTLFFGGRSSGASEVVITGCSIHLISSILYAAE